MTNGFPEGQYFYIKSRSCGSCVDVYMGETTADSNIIIWPQKHGEDKDNQLWRAEDGFLVNKKSNLVIDVRGGDLLSDKPIVQYDRKITMAHNQRWGYRDGYVYVLADPRLVLDIKGGGNKDGTKIILYKRKDTDNQNQQWTIEPYGEPIGGGGMHHQPGQEHAGNVPYYPPPEYPTPQRQEHHSGQEYHSGSGNAPYYPPPSGNFGGYGPPDSQNPRYQ
ncbi:ricin B lectin domain-containing protein [Gilbertella persicaria]|uniref:ricin B lectin domain-containing protein n=1 Tax=Gilbertella persicaria TaxID=101096 RepID=UPI00221EFDDD|nr:ricin B lectin domain-containing protein [Gilbertella persicaria]KAI8087754.1 ricin B lectin domain-containing protein [Gilbertella persicaria]